MPIGAQDRRRLTAAACSVAFVLLSGTMSGSPALAESVVAYARGEPALVMRDPCAQTQFAGAELDCAALTVFGSDGIAAPLHAQPPATTPATTATRRVSYVRLPDHPPPPPRRSLPAATALQAAERPADSHSGATPVAFPEVALRTHDETRGLPVQPASALMVAVDPATGRSSAQQGSRQPMRVAAARSVAPRILMRTDVPVTGPLPAMTAPERPTIEAENVRLPRNPPAPPRNTLGHGHETQIAQATTSHTVLPVVAAPVTTGSVRSTGQAMLRTVQTISPAEDAVPAGGLQAFDRAEPEPETVRRAPPRQRQREPRGGTAMTLDDAIDMAVRRSPKVGLASARSWDAYYGVNVARSVRRPQVDASLGIGQQTLSTERQNESWRFIRGGSEVGYARFDAQLSLRQLIFDFGESQRNVSSANHTYFSQRFRMISRIDQVAIETVAAYLNLMEQRTLITAAEENLETHVEFEELVRLNEANGNGTQADVERIVARRIDAQTLLTDLEAALEDAADQLERLTRVRPGRLADPRSIDRLVPRSAEQALGKLTEFNPDLLAVEAARQAAEYALASQRAKTMPRVEFELTGRNDNYFNSTSRSELDVKSMLTVRHRFSDGGRRRNEMLQLETRVEQEVYRYQDTRIDLEADIRRLYRAIRAANDKVADLEEGLASSRKVRELYTEQFREGGRTLFELLDAQNALFSAIRERTNNRYSRLRAQYQLLRTIGLLGESVYAQMGR